MAESTEKPGNWLIRRGCETFLVLAIFLAGFLIRDYMPGFKPETSQTPPKPASPLPETPTDSVSSQGVVAASWTPPLTDDTSELEPPPVVDVCSPIQNKEPPLPEPSRLVRAERRLIEISMRMTGRVDFDPARIRYVAVPVTGRIDRVYVTSPGLQVQAGEPLVQLFCPDLIPGQTALIDAVGTHKEASGASNSLLSRMKARNVEAAREALRRMGLSVDQIRDIEQAEAPQEHILFRSPISGRLIDCQAREGRYVAQGETLCTVADLSSVRVTLYAQQRDMNWLRYGQRVSFVVEGSETLNFGGLITSLAADIHPETGVWEVHAWARNEHDLLRPGMRLHAQVTCSALGLGIVVDPNRTGQWICPVHPESIAFRTGPCDLCERARVSAASMGYVEMDANAVLPLVVPEEAVFTEDGTTSVTVQEDDQTYRKHTIELAGHLGPWVQVKAGLNEGDLVVIPQEKDAENLP